MPKRYQPAPVALTDSSSLKTLVENRTAYTLQRCELNIFETHQSSALVPLRFSDFVVTSMLWGKKVMHLFDEPGFDYLPGETVLVPAGETMKIDFPEADRQNPTQCIALAIDQEKIRSTLDFLNEQYPKMRRDAWTFHAQHFHFQNSLEVAGLLEKIIRLSSSDQLMKDVLVNISLQELIVTIIQAQQRQQLEDLGQPGQVNSNPLDYITAFIRENIQEDIRLTVLSEKACMSQSTFYRSFKKEFGISPIEFILTEKIKRAKMLLQEGRYPVKTIAYECGFRDLNYFIRVFRKQEGITPGQYEQLLRRS